MLPPLPPHWSLNLEKFSGAPILSLLTESAVGTGALLSVGEAGPRWFSSAALLKGPAFSSSCISRLSAVRCPSPWEETRPGTCGGWEVSSSLAGMHRKGGAPSSGKAAA